MNTAICFLSEHLVRIKCGLKVTEMLSCLEQSSRFPCETDQMAFQSSALLCQPFRGSPREGYQKNSRLSPLHGPHVLIFNYTSLICLTGTLLGVQHHRTRFISWCRTCSGLESSCRHPPKLVQKGRDSAHQWVKQHGNVGRQQNRSQQGSD